MNSLNGIRSIRKKSSKGRFFLDQSDLGEARFLESVEYSRAKRNGNTIEGVTQKPWPCGCCWDTSISVTSNPTIKKCPKGQRKPKIKSNGKECIHFSGKSID